MIPGPGWITASPALALVAPLLGAIAAFLLGRRQASAWAAGGGLALATAAGAVLVISTLTDGRIEGGFGAGAAWRFEIDVFTACAMTAVFALAAVAALAQPAPTPAAAGVDPIGPGAVAIAAALAGFAITTSDLVTAAAATWGAGVAGVTAAAGARASADRRVIGAGFEALVAVSIAGALAVIGAGLVTAATGGAVWMVREAAEIQSPRALAFGLGLALAGLGSLAALAPLHTGFAPIVGRSGVWAPLVGAVAALVVALRFAGAALQTGDAIVPWLACVVLAALGAASIAAGALQALAARDDGRLIAYVVTGHLGMAALGVGLGTQEGATAAVLHAGLAVLALGVLVAAWPAIGALGFDGLGARAPALAAATTAALLSLLGAPLTAGFAGKWLLAAAALERGWYWAAWLVAGAALAGVVYTARVLERIWMRPSAGASPGMAPSSVLAWAGGIACLALGFDARGAEAMAHLAAQALMGAIR